jgi:flagellar hook-associated protein 1 FlgK
MLEELAKLVDVDYHEDELGILTVSCNGQILVSAAKNHELIASRTNLTTNDGYEYSRLEVTLSTTSKPFMPKYGELKALMEIRDVDIPKYEGYLNEMAQTLITEVNKIHQAGYTLSGTSFVEFFDSDPKKFYASNIDLSAAIYKDINNIAAAAGGKTTTQPRADFVTFLDTSNPTKPILNLRDILVPGGSSYSGLCKGSLVIEGGFPQRILTEGLDYYVDYETSQIIFNDNTTNPLEFQSNPLLLTFDYNESGYDGPGGFENALAISQLRDKALMHGDMFGNSTQTLNEFYSGMLGRLGTERNEAGASLDTRTHALLQLKTRQDEVMGVNLDEEVANLIQFQHSYQASARYLTTINTMLETLLNM